MLLAVKGRGQALLVLREVLDVVDRPIGLSETGTNSRDVVSTVCIPSGVSATGASPSRTSPISAEGQVEDGVVVVEVLAWGAGASGPVSKGRGPVGRHGLTGSNVVWDSAASEEPDSDTITIPFHGIDTSAGAVESTAKAVVRGGVGESAASVIAIAGAAVGIGKLTSGRSRVVGACSTSFRGVEGRLVLGLAVDTFNDINLTTSWPIWSVGPPGWPRATSGWHVRGIHDEESALVEGVVVGDTDRLAITNIVSSIGPHERLTI